MCTMDELRPLERGHNGHEVTVTSCLFKSFAHLEIQWAQCYAASLVKYLLSVFFSLWMVNMGCMFIQTIYCMFNSILIVILQYCFLASSVSYACFLSLSCLSSSSAFCLLNLGLHHSPGWIGSGQGRPYGGVIPCFGALRTGRLCQYTWSTNHWEPAEPEHSGGQEVWVGDRALGSSKQQVGRLPCEEVSIMPHESGRLVQEIRKLPVLGIWWHI